MRCVDNLRMWLLLLRVRTDPARFLERAGWHVEDTDAGSCLISASRYVAAGEAIPRWLIG